MAPSYRPSRKLGPPLPAPHGVRAAWEGAWLPSSLVVRLIDSCHLQEFQMHPGAACARRRLPVKPGF